MLTNAQVLDAQATITAARQTAESHYQAAELARQSGDDDQAIRLAGLGALADDRADERESELAGLLGS